MNLENMGLEEYRQRIEPKFKRKKVDPPKNLNTKYFNEDGSGKDSLDEILSVVKDLWRECSKEKFEAVYVCGSNTNEKYKEGDDFDIGILFYCSLSDAIKMQEKINQLTFGRLNPNFEEAQEQFDQGRRDFFQITIDIVNPPGKFYDLEKKEWASFGKTEEDHDSYKWHVLGQRVD